MKTNLFLVTLGSNPMPIYMTLRYLFDGEREDQNILPIPDAISFIYSSGTETYYRTICDLLKKAEVADFRDESINLGNGERNHNLIKDRVMKKLKSLREEDLEHIHLNYTGGTKPMAVAVATALGEFERTIGLKNVLYSDFHPKKFKLFLRDGNSFPTESLKRKNYFNIEDLLVLHGVKSVSVNRDRSDVMSKFGHLIEGKLLNDANSSSELMKAWDGWPRKSKCKDVRKELKTKSHGEMDTLREQLLMKLDDEKANEYLTDIDQNEMCKTMKSLAEFIQGKWLEEYLFDILNEIKQEVGITDLAWSVEGKTAKGADFEVDVVALIGCQPVVFSCTTDRSKPLCKSKAFEGLFRAGQMGGGEMKTVLVSCAKETTVEEIEKDLAHFETSDKVMIYGVEDIVEKERFKTKLLEFLRGQK